MSTVYIGECFAGEGVNAAHINIVMGDKTGVAGQAFANSLASPSRGHVPFMVIAKPGLPIKPATLYTNKAEISSELHGNATWGASQAGIAKAVQDCLKAGILPQSAADDWCIITANWVNPGCDDLNAVFDNNYQACKTAIINGLGNLPATQAVLESAIHNPFYTPK